MVSICSTIFIVIFAFVLYKIHVSLNEEHPVPKLEDTYWGSGEKEEDTEIKPFKISVPDQVLEDLRYRLEHARPFQPPLEGAHQHYGINTNLLDTLVDYWKSPKYEWRARERYLNQFPQYTIRVQGLRIHYIHVKPTITTNTKKVVYPLLLLHGWPGSIREFYDIIPLLTTPRDGYDFVFEVIAPSLPGYGFSEATSKAGLGVAQIANLFKNFMRRIGFADFYVQGGDWGALIGTSMVTLYPDNVRGFHSNMCVGNTAFGNLKLLLGSLYPAAIVEAEHQSKVYPLKAFFERIVLETGYMHLQATKPDTVGVGLNDSPVGLAAYIVEKFITWTNNEWKNHDDGRLKEKWTFEQLLDNVMIYWVSGSITTSMRLYAESLSDAQRALGLEKIPTQVPTACARFAHELSYSPTTVLKGKYHNLVHVSDLEGGHFAAFEAPKLLADDIFEGISKINNTS